MSPQRPRFSAATSHAACALVLGAAAFAPPSAAWAGGGGVTRPPRHKEGDVLRVFDGANVVVVTNEDANLVDALLDNTHPKEKRILSVADWTQQADHGDGRGEVRVFLINREKLPVSGLPAINAARRMPGGACSDNDDLWAWARRTGKTYDGRDSMEITLSAPDGAWLRQDVGEFRRWAEVPNEPQKRPVPSLAVVPIGGGAMETANTLVSAERSPNDARSRFHSVSLSDWAKGNLRNANSDEIVLIDRSSSTSGVSDAAASVSALTTGKTIAPSDTVAWREMKNTDKTGRTRWRVVISAPNGPLLSDALQKYPDPRRVPTTPLVVHTARDLRQVRRVAVACVKNNRVGADMVKRLASRTATELRTLDAFEVPDRAGLSEILSEIALQQAGITQAKDRAKVQQLAAADALLIVEITDASGRTDYEAQHERITPRMSRSPRKPLEPSHLKYALTLPGKEDDPTMRGIAEALFSRAIGTKTDEEYQRDLSRYNDEILPRWQQTVQQFQREHDTRRVEWKEVVQSKSKVIVTGSLRLVDLTDGLVLWETPFTAADSDEQAEGAKTVTSRGEDSAPPTDGCPPPTNHVPDTLIARCAESVLSQTVRGLRTSALLPAPVPSGEMLAAASSPAMPTTTTGKLLDIDGDTFLIGLGQTDNVKVGDTLTLSLDNGKTLVSLTVTRARPRTCDAQWDKKTPAALLGRVVVGQLVMRELPAGSPTTTASTMTPPVPERKTP